MALEIGFIDLVAGAEGLFQYLGGDQVAVFGPDHGVGAAGGGRADSDIDDQAGGAVQLDDKPFFEIRGGKHVNLLAWYVLFFTVFGRGPEGDAATRGELAAHRQPGWVKQFDKVITDAIDAGFME